MYRTPSLALCITLVWTLSAVVPAQAQQPGTVLSHQKISDTQGGFTGTLDNENLFGFSVTSLGDLDGGGVGGRIGPSERANRRDTRRKRPCGLNRVSQFGYNGGLRFDRWVMPAGTSSP